MLYKRQLYICRSWTITINLYAISNNTHIWNRETDCNLQ